jgi:hypothetical protein
MKDNNPAPKAAATGSAISDEFRGDNTHLKSCINALINLSDDGALIPHGIGGHARELLAACYHRLPGKDVHEALREADAALNQAADLAALTETTDSQHSLASRLMMPLEKASSNIRRFLDDLNAEVCQP